MGSPDVTPEFSGDAGQFGKAKHRPSVAAAAQAGGAKYGAEM